RLNKLLIKDVVLKIIADISTTNESDPLYRAELQLIRAELNLLIAQYGNQPVTPQTIEPFIEFLAKRWRRVTAEVKAENPDLPIGTDLIYPHAMKKPATVLCSEV